MFKLIAGVLCVGAGVWLAFNEPAMAEMFLNELMNVIYYIIDWLNGVLKR